MSLDKKILTLAIVAGLFAGAAEAAVNISDPTSEPVVIASELVIGAAGLEVNNVGHALDVDTAVGAAFAQGQVRFARIECSDSMTFESATVTSETNPATVLGAVNGAGTNAVFFSITSGATPVAATDILRVHGSRSFSANTPVACDYGLYAEQAQAAAGGTDGLLASASDAFLRFESSYLYDIAPETEIASVETTPTFSAFVGDNAATARLATVAFDTRAAITRGAESQPFDADGAPIALADILAPGTAHVVTGDFSLAFDANGNAVPASVFINEGNSCTTGTSTPATTVTSTTATFELGAADLAQSVLCYTPRAGASIPASDYSIRLVPVSNAGYTAGALGPVDAGLIVHDGTELQAPLAQVPNDWLSRMVLTNTGNSARAYTITVFGEEGNNIDTANLTGTVPAGGTEVVDLRTVLTGFTGAPRATLNVIVEGPNDQIQGLYQIVNPASGSVSNHVMVRPGTN